VAKGFASLDRIQVGKEMLLRIVAMLTKLLMRFDPEHTGSTRAQQASATLIQKRGRQCDNFMAFMVFRR
jgi:hypothetical protein